jgi:hypothetical protein
MKFYAISATAIALTLLLSAPAHAKSFSVPADKPLASIEAADDWKTDDSDKDGIVTTSADDAVLIAAGAAPAADEDKVLEGLVALLTKNGFKPDDSTKKTAETEADLDGSHAKISVLSYKGKDNDGPASVNITSYSFDKRPDQVFVLGLLVGSKVTKDDEDAAGKVMESIHFTP